MINRKSIEDSVREEILKRDLPLVCWRIRSHKEVYPHDIYSTPKRRYCVQLTIPSSDHKALFEGTSHSFIDFWYNQRQKYIFGVNLFVHSEYRNLSYGKRFVEIMENVGKKLGCNSIRFGLNINEEFWEHTGYVPLKSNYHIWIKRLQ